MVAVGVENSTETYAKQLSTAWMHSDLANNV